MAHLPQHCHLRHWFMHPVPLIPSTFQHCEFAGFRSRCRLLPGLPFPLTLHTFPPPLVLIDLSQHPIVISRFSLLPPLTPCHLSLPPPPPSRAHLHLLLPEPRLLLLVQACCRPRTPKRQALQYGPRCTQTPPAACSKCSPPPRTDHPRFQVSFTGLSARS